MMVYQYKHISRSKYKDINLSRWFQPISKSQIVIPVVSQEVVKSQKKIELKRKEKLTKENQLYLEKRLKTDFSV